MKLREIRESKKDKHFFSYKELADDMWRDKLKEKRDEMDINFDTENDDAIVQREVEIDQNQWEHTKCKFKCELRSAGGDWESPVLYFRCELVDGYAKGLSKYGDPHFVFIPSKEDGNNLVKGKKGGWTAPESETKTRGNEWKAWAALKKYLKKLVDDEIAEVQKGNL